MHLNRLIIVGIAATALACSGDDIINSSPPPLAGVRYINALSDTGAVDIRMVDQVDWSAYANALAYRAGTEQLPTEAKARHIKVFSFASRDISVVQQVLVDTTMTFAANTNYTLLLTGSARSKAVKFIVIADNPAQPATGSIGIRLVNASGVAVSGYVTTNSTDAIGTTANFSNVAPLTASAYATRTASTTAIRVTGSGSTTVNASAQGPTATAPLVNQLPLAAVNSSGSALSAYYFPAGVAGSATASVTTPTVIWFVDLVPRA